MNGIAMNTQVGTNEEVAVEIMEVEANEVGTLKVTEQSNSQSVVEDVLELEDESFLVLEDDLFEEEESKKAELTVPEVTEEDDDSLDLEEFDLNDFTQTVAQSQPSKLPINTGGMSIVNNKNGRRVTFCNDIWNSLNKSKKVEFYKKSGQLLVKGSDKEEAATGVYKMSPDPKKAIIYNAALVHELTEFYNLDYQNGRTSYGFTDYKTVTVQGEKAVLINM